MRPFEHQTKALELLKANGQGALLLEPGLGKTKVVIDYLAWRDRPENWLVVAPLGALNTWRQQLELHMPTSTPYTLHVLDNGTTLQKAQQLRDAQAAPEHLHIWLCNIDMFSQRQVLPDYKAVTITDRLVASCEVANLTGLIIDESHKVKNHTSNRTRGLRRVAKHVKHRILLTGTVAPNNPTDIFGQWTILNPDRFGTKYRAFCDKYVQYGGYQNREIVGYKNQDKLKELMNRDSFCATKEQCLDLPPVTDQTIPVSLDKDEQVAYRRLGKDLLVDIANDEVATVRGSLVKALRLRQITSGYVGYKDPHGIGQTKTLGNSKLDVLLDRLEPLTDNGDKVVVFCQFLHDIAKIEKALSKKKYFVAVISGYTRPMQRRSELLQQFAETQGPAVLVAQIQTMGISINELVCANQAIFYSMSTRREDYVQARGRLDRQGQTRNVTFQHLIAAGTIDQAIYDAHERKQSLEDVLMADPEKYLLH